MSGFSGEWISARKPRTGSLCLIVWAETVQHCAYRRVGKGFACAGGYEWVTASGEGDALPDDEVQFWMYFPDPPKPEDRS